MQNGHRVRLPEEFDLMISISLLRGDIADLRADLSKRNEPPHATGWTTPIIALLKEAREFVEAIASLKEIVFALALMMASSAIISHPEAVTGIIASYHASGHVGRE